MSSVAPDYEECRSRIEKLTAWYGAHLGDRNEATTRLQLVDRLFFECLGWDRSEGIELENEENREYADYLFTTTKDVLIVEAKREGKTFELPAGSARLKYSIASLMRDYPELRKALRQVAGYCWERGVPYGVVCNGHQVVAFVASRSDGVRPLDGQALVFPSLEFMAEHFLELWQALSKPGIMENKLYARLVGDATPDLPPKLSASILTYPGTKERNVFQADLMNLSELVIEDIVRSPEVEATFLRECYCSNDALSQYSQLSRDILSARYAALFDDESPGPATVPVRTKKGISQELLAESLSRRPILLLGDVGVGKTTFLRHLILIDAEELLDNAISLYVNLGSRGTLDYDLRGFIIEEIEDQLLHKYDIYIKGWRFVRGVYDYELKLLARENSGDQYEDRYEEYEKKKSAYLEEKKANRVEHLRRSLLHLSKARRRQIVIFLDNTDQRDPKDQDQAFLIAEDLAGDWDAAVYLPIRPETFHHSRKFGALSGYHAKAFTISPPRVDLVIERRLHFALRFTKGELPLRLGSRGDISVKMSVLDALIRVFIQSIKNNRDLIELLDNISNGNIRLVLDLVKQFFGSGHVNTQKIYRKSPNYTIPLHEFLRAVLFGDHVFYDPDRSPIANLYDLTWNDPKEHFLLPMLIGTVQQSRTSGTTQGFVDTRIVYQKLQGLGFAPEQIDHAIAKAIGKKLLESPARRVPEPGQNTPKVIRVTSFGLYHAHKLSGYFAYFDAVVVDIPILDAEYRRQIRLVDEGVLEERIQRVNLLKSYLDQCWKSVPSPAHGFDWTSISDDLLTDMVRVRESNRRQRER